MNQSDRVKIAKRVVEELPEGAVVNLGVGIPTLIPDYLDGKKVYLQSENGLLGIGPTPDEEHVNMDLISASKKPITMDTGASLFDSADSFVVIRGGHVDAAVLGALQVDRYGEIANWAVPGKKILGVGGAMDLVAGAKKIIIASTHQAKNNQPKLVEKLTFPSSGVRKAEMLVTEHAVFKFTEDGPVLIEKLSDISMAELREITGTEFKEKIKI
ncbi:3-oxoacid CoA-transferase/3-oxoacid CoA-transferase subunit B [Salinibacillus kushneri]|uniref:3-oxoacid CoA-transferase/3-oxoacid CoA-transferase subunit B n=1 Tax=Salinibacillus kushneri TaxID=237682 RepID=A0A1H9ZAZ1_9BACI|nr:3-oxoacid CoA-transferase subunit B [Salinibacillus kushneri]SES78021.1 3-oxoacid CoA-transferase/3-oxoacid CoA-transferase subunit B [Salinibacillus kushneri]